LIAQDVVEFENLAVTLARTPELLTELRTRLEQRRAAGPPFETVRFVRALERAFQMMWAAHEAGKVPKNHVIQIDGAVAMKG
jgi:predicted O-linked N-acetylglucosamine transferase (SPINDLY family)